MADPNARLDRAHDPRSRAVVARLALAASAGVAAVKQCISCELVLPPDQFYRLATAHDHLHPNCKACHKAAAKVRYYAKHRQILADKRAYRHARITLVREKDRARYYAKRRAECPA